MSKYCLYDNVRKEFVIDEGITAIGNKIVYETSKSPDEVTEIVSKPIADNTLRKLENQLHLSNKELSCHELTEKEMKKVDQYNDLQRIKDYLDDYIDYYYQDSKAVKQLFKMISNLMNEYGVIDEFQDYVDSI